MSILSEKHQVLSEKYKKLEKDYFELKQSEKNSKEAKLLKEIKRLKVENVALTEKSEKFELQLQGIKCILSGSESNQSQVIQKVIHKVPTENTSHDENLKLDAVNTKPFANTQLDIRTGNKSQVIDMQEASVSENFLSKNSSQNDATQLNNEEVNDSAQTPVPTELATVDEPKEIDLKKKASQLNVTPGFIKYLESQQKPAKRKYKREIIGRKSLPSKRACTSVLGILEKDPKDAVQMSTRKEVSYSEVDSSEEFEEYFCTEYIGFTAKSEVDRSLGVITDKLLRPNEVNSTTSFKDREIDHGKSDEKY